MDINRRSGAIIRRCVKEDVHFIVERNELPTVVILPYADYKALSVEFGAHNIIKTLAKK